MSRKESGSLHPWSSQSFRYFSIPEPDCSGPYLPEEVREVLSGSDIQSVLDVGCGNGNFLEGVMRELSIPVGTGLEPSGMTVARLREKWGSRTDLEFVFGAAEQIPFPDRSFDLVIAWSVLHWVSRESYLQALGEMVRTTARYLLVMDFCPAEDYRTPYKHRPGWYTYKSDFHPPLLSSGILETVTDLRWSDSGTRGWDDLNETDLMPFLRNPKNWTARRCVLYKKTQTVLSEWVALDFEL